MPPSARPIFRAGYHSPSRHRRCRPHGTGLAELPMSGAQTPSGAKHGTMASDGERHTWSDSPCAHALPAAPAQEATGWPNIMVTPPGSPLAAHRPDMNRDPCRSSYHPQTAARRTRSSSARSAALGPANTALSDICAFAEKQRLDVLDDAGHQLSVGDSVAEGGACVAFAGEALGEPGRGTRVWRIG